MPGCRGSVMAMIMLIKMNGYNMTGQPLRISSMTDFFRSFSSMPRSTMVGVGFLGVWIFIFVWACSDIDMGKPENGLAPGRWVACPKWGSKSHNETVDVVLEKVK